MSQKDVDGNKELVALNQTARILKVNSKTIKNWIDLGIINAYKAGPQDKPKFLLEDIRTFLHRVKH